MGVTLEQFIQDVTRSGLMSAGEMATFQQRLPPARRPRDAEALARELVAAHKLTRYQAAAVAQGQAKKLFFDQYVILDKLGQGGMGMVLKAEHRKMKRRVAIKVISPTAVKSPEAVRRFYREVEAAAQLSHPNIVAAYDANEHSGTHYLVMEYVEGRDLAAIVKEHGPLPVRQAVECVVQAARGLQYAHEQGIIHRDIKPGNLLLDKKGVVKILDMGLARMDQAAREEVGGERLTESGQIMGTGEYMAPEQALDTHRADARSDIYSLGCTLYRLLTGKPPYQGETFTQLFVAHREAPIPSLVAKRSDVPAALDAVFQRMIAKLPDERQQTMSQVIAELEALERAPRGSGSDDEASSGAFAFLREYTATAGTATRQKVSTPVEHTFDHGSHPETGTNIGLRLGATIRARRGLVIGLGLVVVGLSAAVVCGVVLTIRHPDGKQTTIQVPDGSHVAIGKDGQVDVTVEGTGNRGQGTGGKGRAVDEDLARSEKRWGLKRQQPEPAAAPSGGFDPKQAGQVTGNRLQGTGSPSPSRFVDSAGNWKLPPNAPPPAIAPFDAATAKQHQVAWAKHLGVPVETTNSIGMKLALIPPGEFDMGSTPEEQAWALEDGKKSKESQWYFDHVPSEGPRHRVKISTPFCLGVYPVTQSEYEKVMGVNPSAFTENPMGASTFAPPLSEGEVKNRPEDAKRVASRDTSRHPVETVSWTEAVEFCRRLSEMPAELAAKRVYRLPTEAEWEYACRAGTTTRWWCGDDEAGLQDIAWYNKNAGRITHAVGEKRASPWGLFDIHGNVYQWCLDRYEGKYYEHSPSLDPTGPMQGVLHIMRGGAWGNCAGYCRSAYRIQNCVPGGRRADTGLRVCLVLADRNDGQADAGTPVLGAAASPLAADAAQRSAGEEPEVRTPSPFLDSAGNWKLPKNAPPPAVAPFDAAAAKQHQAAWARHLGVAVETTNSIGMKLALIPPGEFQMGSTPEEIERALAEGKKNDYSHWYFDRVPSEGPRHRVKISRPYYLASYLVTQGEYERVVGVNPSAFTEKQMQLSAFQPPFSDGDAKVRLEAMKKVLGRDTSRHPVETVSWTDAEEFCRRLSAIPAERAAKRVYRLPTEAEWEYACRVGTTTRWWCGDEEAGLHGCAWYRENAGRMTHAVGEKRASPWGLYDMHGNVWQWCADWYDARYYEQSPSADPTGPAGGSYHVPRGGTWDTYAALCRCAYRSIYGIGARNCYSGFRVCLGVDESSK
jgi:formylglycine-generating enzyme required for sulfatase activity/serine/threonine protein kinase